MKKLQNKPFALLGVNSDTDRAALKNVLLQEKITWRSWWEGGKGGPIARKYQIAYYPTIYVLDHNGVIRYKDLHDQALEQAVAVLLKRVKSDVVKAPAKEMERSQAPSVKKAKPAVETADAEEAAARKLKFARMLAEAGKTEKARERCEEIAEKYAGTSAAKEAKEMLDTLKK